MPAFKLNTPLKDLVVNLFGEFIKSPSLFMNKWKLPSKNNKYGTIVKLFSKCIGVPATRATEVKDTAFAAEVIKLQEKLSQVTDMIYMSHLLHQKVLNFDNSEARHKNDEKHGEIISGNLIAILGGDKLLVNVFRALAELRNPFIFEYMFQAIEDFWKYSFALEEEVDFSKPECVMKSIETSCHLTGGSLLGNSFKCAALLAGYTETNDKLFLNDVLRLGHSVGIIVQIHGMLNSNSNQLTNLEKLNNETRKDYLKKVLKNHFLNCSPLFDMLPKSDSTVSIKKFVASQANIPVSR